MGPLQYCSQRRWEGDIPMMNLGKVFQAKGPARPRPEVGKACHVQETERQHLGRGENDRGEVSIARDQGKKLGLSSKESHRRLTSRE